MKNITFNESSVLNEFARIAHEKDLLGLRKEAQQTPVQPAFQQPAQPQQSNIFTQKVAQLNNWYGTKAGQITMSSADEATKANQLKKLKGDFLKMRDNTAKILMRYRTKQNAASFDAAMQNFKVQTQAIIQDAAEDSLVSENSTAPETVKEAAGQDKSYDVSGETGKDLIDAAHPGGGTKTEVTHSKTKENLVETIIEQQERDIEVARKVPKGTYASLVGLYSVLNKMGYTEHLAELKDLIVDVAAEDEDAVIYTLSTLSKELDQLDYKEAAVKVNFLLRFAADRDTALWTGVGAGAAAGLSIVLMPFAPLIGYIAYEMARVDKTLDDLIDRFEALDPDDRIAPTINEWMSRMNDYRAALAPQWSEDPEEDARLAKEQYEQLIELDKFLRYVNSKWPQAKQYFTDWGRDVIQAEKALASVTAYVAQQVQAMTPKVEQSKAKVEQQTGQSTEEPTDPELVPIPGSKTKKKPKYKYDPEVAAKQKEYNDKLLYLHKNHRNEVDLRPFIVSKRGTIRVDGFFGPESQAAFAKLDALRKLYDQFATGGAEKKVEQQERPATETPTTAVNASEFLHYAQQTLARNVGTDWPNLNSKLRVTGEGGIQWINRVLTDRINEAIKDAQAPNIWNSGGAKRYIMDYINRALSDQHFLGYVKRMAKIATTYKQDNIIKKHSGNKPTMPFPETAQDISEFLTYARRTVAKNAGTSWATIALKIPSSDVNKIDKWLASQINIALKQSQTSKMWGSEGIKRYVITYLDRALADPHVVGSVKRISGT